MGLFDSIFGTTSTEAQITWSDLDVLAAIVAFIAAIEIADDYKDVYNESVDCWEDITNRQIDMFEELSDCYCNVTYPQLDEALTCALQFNADVQSCSRYQEFIDCATEVTNCFQQAEQIYLDDYCVGEAGSCDNEWSHVTAINAANMNITLWAHQERRSETLLQEKVRAILRAKQASYFDPSAINALMGNAAQIKGAMAGQAAQGYNGALSTAGYVFNGFLGNGLGQ